MKSETVYCLSNLLSGPQTACQSANSNLKNQNVALQLQQNTPSSTLGYDRVESLMVEVSPRLPVRRDIYTY